MLHLYLLSHSADIHSDVPSRVADADHQHPFPLQAVGAAIVPAVEVSALEVLDA